MYGSRSVPTPVALNGPSSTGIGHLDRNVHAFPRMHCIRLRPRPSRIPDLVLADRKQCFNTRSVAYYNRLCFRAAVAESCTVPLPTWQIAAICRSPAGKSTIAKPLLGESRPPLAGIRCRHQRQRRWLLWTRWSDGRTPKKPLQLDPKTSICGSLGNGQARIRRLWRGATND
jgi:hypothetical protein